ncbi:hypothetical protein F0266_13830 [Vibrio coralliilyticus]|nr:hypothetical protein [Vibrio coralliilyticus]
MDLMDKYKYAFDARNNEINLFWQRCNYFMVLNTAIAIGFFVRGTTDKYSAIICGIGAIVSFAWYLVSIGSKFWQSRWENRLKIIENEIGEDINLFSASWEVIESDVKASLANNRHKELRKLFNYHVMLKPSVSFTMSLLALFFVFTWLVMLIIQLW